MSEKKDEKKLKVDADICISCGSCYGAIAPELFASDDEGKSIIIKQPETPEETQKAKEAIDSCPTQAISY